MVHRVEQVLHALVVAQPGAGDARAAQSLDRERVAVHPLDVSLAAVDDNAGVVRDDVNLLELELRVLHDLGLAVAAVLVGNLHALLKDQVVDHVLAAQQLVDLGNPLLQDTLFLDELVLLDRGEPPQRHAEEALDLLGAQGELILQRGPHLAQVRTVLDDAHDVVQVIDADQEPLDEVEPLGRLVLLKQAPLLDDLLPELQELLEEVLEQQRPRDPVHQGNHVAREAGLYGRVLLELVHHELGRRPPLFDLDHDAKSGPIRLVADVRNTRQLPVVHQVGNLLDEIRLDRLVRELGDDDLGPLLVGLLDVHLGTHGDRPFARGVGLLDAVALHDLARGGKVRARDVLHQLHV